MYSAILLVSLHLPASDVTRDQDRLAPPPRAAPAPRVPEQRAPEAPGNEQEQEANPYPWAGNALGGGVVAATSGHLAALTLSSAYSVVSPLVSVLSSVCPPLSFVGLLLSLAMPAAVAMTAWWASGRVARWRAPWFWLVLTTYGTTFAGGGLISLVMFAGYVISVVVMVALMGTLALTAYAGGVGAMLAAWPTVVGAWAGYGVLLLLVMGAIVGVLASLTAVAEALLIGLVAAGTGRPLRAGESPSLEDVFSVPKDPEAPEPEEEDGEEM